MRVEHHDGFTAVYWDGQLAALVFQGTREEREAAPAETWYRLSTWAGSD